MVAAKLPTEPAQLENVSMYGFGAIPNLEELVTWDEPLKRRLRPRRDRVQEEPNTDVFIVNARQRGRATQRQSSSSSKPKPRARQTPGRVSKTAKAKPGSKGLPIEILDSEKNTTSSP
jgi:hypothetical protein